MNTAYLFLSGLAGLAVGTVFYGGLLWTVQRLPNHPHPAVLTLGSFIFRCGLVVATALLIGWGNWQRMVALLIGMIAARLLLVPLLARTRPRRKETA